MRPMNAMRLVLFLLLAALLSTPLVSCSNGGDEGPAPTLDQVHERMKASATREGYILHGTSVIHAKARGESLDETMEYWLDVQHDLGRMSEQTGSESTVRIVVGSELWVGHTVFDPSEAEPCFGNEHALCLLLEGGMGAGPESTPVMSRHDGRWVIDLPLQSEFNVLDVAMQIEGHQYLNHSTFLPVAGVYEWVGESGGTPIASGFVEEFGEYDFLPLDSLADDFFDPASIGYVEPDLESQLNANLPMTVYWLGKDFPGSGSLPPLTLAGVTIPDSELGNKGQYVKLEYRLASGEFGSPVLSLEEFDLDGWNDSMGDTETSLRVPVARIPGLVRHWWDLPCRETKDIQMPGGHAIIILGFNLETLQQQPMTAAGDRTCPSQPYDRFMAQVFVGSTVLLIDDADFAFGESDVLDDSPYDSVEGMEAVLNGLEPRE